MRIQRLTALGAMLLALFVSANLARADVMDQVPGDAMVVFKVKNLDAASKKVAKWAKDLGLDVQEPAWADPLGAIADKTQMGKGVNRNGDLAIVLLDKDKFGGDMEKAVLALVPVTDYKAFLGNLKDTADAGGGVTRGTPQEGGPDALFVANWGQYAAVSANNNLVSRKPAGIKLIGFSAKESAAKDALVYVNIKAVRDKVMPELKNGRQFLTDMITTEMGGDNAKKYAPLAKAAVNQLINVAEGFFNDAHSATLGIELTDAGISATVAADFSPTSYAGKLALETKGTAVSMLNGLPDRKYFFFAGAEGNPKVAQRVLSDLVDPIIKELRGIEETKTLAGALESAKKAYGSMTGTTIGLVAPTGALGQESILQQVAITRGDAKVLHASQREMLTSMNDLMQLIPQPPGMKSTFELKQNAKTIGGVPFDAYETKMAFAADDPVQRQAEEMLKFIYGQHGQTGVIGPVNGKTLLTVQGGDDALIADSVAAAKADADTLGAMAGVRAVANALPKERSFVMYIDVGTIVNTVAKYAKGFGAPINVKVPADLPPIGMTAGAEGTAFRCDVHVPNRLVQGMVSAYMQAQQQQQNPNGGL